MRTLFNTQWPDFDVLAAAFQQAIALCALMSWDAVKVIGSRTQRNINRGNSYPT